jgi:hypothetical protein
VVRIFHPKVAREGIRVSALDEADADEAVDRLVAFLSERDLA